jgi:hypothetical protein
LISELRQWLEGSLLPYSTIALGLLFEITLSETTFQELSGFDFNNNYKLRVELFKEYRQYFIFAECILKEKHQPLKVLLV